MKYKTLYNSPIGKIILLSDGKCLIGLDFETSMYIDKINNIEAIIEDELEIFKNTKAWLDKYFQGKNPNPNEIKIKLEGSSFSLKVWETLKRIPYGKIVTYGDITEEFKKQENVQKMSAQAVAHAIGKNPISIIVPCHRVIGAKGNLTGYGGGIDKKIALLKVENVDTNNLYIPTKGNAL